VSHPATPPPRGQRGAARSVLARGAAPALGARTAASPRRSLVPLPTPRPAVDGPNTKFDCPSAAAGKPYLPLLKDNDTMALFSLYQFNCTSASGKRVPLLSVLDGSAAPAGAADAEAAAAAADAAAAARPVSVPAPAKSGGSVLPANAGAIAGAWDSGRQRDGRERIRQTARRG
jgi:hypothetical protein